MQLFTEKITVAIQFFKNHMICSVSAWKVTVYVSHKLFIL